MSMCERCPSRLFVCKGDCALEVSYQESDFLNKQRSRTQFRSFLPVWIYAACQSFRDLMTDNTQCQSVASDNGNNPHCSELPRKWNSSLSLGLKWHELCQDHGHLVYSLQRNSTFVWTFLWYQRCVSTLRECSDQSPAVVCNGLPHLSPECTPVWMWWRWTHCSLWSSSRLHIPWQNWPGETTLDDRNMHTYKKYTKEQLWIFSWRWPVTQCSSLSWEWIGMSRAVVVTMRMNENMKVCVCLWVTGRLEGNHCCWRSEKRIGVGNFHFWLSMWSWPWFWWGFPWQPDSLYPWVCTVLSSPCSYTLQQFGWTLWGSLKTHQLSQIPFQAFLRYPHPEIRTICSLTLPHKPLTNFARVCVFTCVHVFRAGVFGPENIFKKKTFLSSPKYFKFQCEEEYYEVFIGRQFAANIGLS